jgi:hypothetical protein
MTLDEKHIAAYLAHQLGRAVRVLALQALGPAPSAASDNQAVLKVYGYGQLDTVVGAGCIPHQIGMLEMNGRSSRTCRN